MTTNYESNFFTVKRIYKENDNIVIIFDCHKSDVGTRVKSPILENLWVIVEQIESEHDHVLRYKATCENDGARPEYYLNYIELGMKGCDFTANDHYHFVKNFSSLRILADAIINKCVFEDGKYPELVDKIENYIFKDSPYYHSDDKHYSYINDILFYNGVSGLVSHIADLDMISVDTMWSREDILGEDISEALNEYDDSVIHEDSVKYFKSFSEGSLIPQFAVKTNGFNQDFRGKNSKDAYSSVTIKQWKVGEKYHVRINGADDCSYGREFDSLEEAKRCAKQIKCVSTILLLKHLNKLGFHFTN